MKHWDGRDLTEATELRPTQRDVARMRDLLREPRTTKRAEPQIASLIGLAFAIVFLAVLSWAVAPTSPVSAQLHD